MRRDGVERRRGATNNIGGEVLKTTLVVRRTIVAARCDEETWI